MNPKESDKLEQKQKTEPLSGVSGGVKSLALASTISGYVLGPILLFGCIGWLLSDYYHNRAFVFIGVGTAFITTNILIIRSSKKITKRF